MPLQLQRMRDYIAAEQERVQRQVSAVARHALKSPTAKHRKKHDDIVVQAIRGGAETQRRIINAVDLTPGEVRHAVLRLVKHDRIRAIRQDNIGGTRSNIYRVTE